VKARHEFVLNALAPDANVSALCREAGISRKTGYKWMKRICELVPERWARERGLIASPDQAGEQPR